MRAEKCDIIVELKFIQENDLISALSAGLGLPLIDLKRFKVEPEVVKTLPVDVARQYQILAIAKMSDTITLAMADPLNIFAIDHVKSLTGYKINPIISSAQDINQAIDLYYPETTKNLINDLVKEMTDSSIEVIKQDQEAALDDQELGRISREAPVIKLTDMIIEKAVVKKASDVLIEPLEKKLRIRLRIDGVLTEEDSPPKNLHSSVISRIKVISNLNVAEHSSGRSLHPCTASCGIRLC